MPLKPKIIDHVTIIIKDLEATRAFYTEVLGLEEVERPAFGFPGLWLQAGPSQIHATVEGPEAGRAGWGDRDVGVLSRGHHFAFEVDDVFEAAAELERLGVEILDGPRPRPDGPQQMYVKDPDGHTVEIFSFLKAS